MGKWIVWLVVLAGLGFVGYKAYEEHRQKVEAGNGDYTCIGCDSPEAQARFRREKSGDSADGNSEHKLTSARIAAEQAAAGDSSSNAQVLSGSEPVRPAYGNSSMVAPGEQNVYAPAVTQAAPATSQPAALPQAVAGLPARDSESPNAPNGMRFSGSGAYQWYRQGNITWRIDTNTGRSCIIYATMEEWRKQIVMSHGCGRDA